MKTAIAAALFVLSSTPALASGTLDCMSNRIYDGWTGSTTHNRVHLTARVASATELNDVVVTGAWATDRRNLTADVKYQPRSPRYQNFDRYPVLEDAWCWYTPVLPKELDRAPLNRPFPGYIQMICEEGRGAQTIDLRCVLR